MEHLTAQKIDKLWTFFGPLFFIFLALDQLSKWWAVSSLELGTYKPFGFALTFNTGAVFGIDLPQWFILILTAGILGMGAYLVVVNQLWRNHFHLFALALLLAGAIGNLIDRLRFGYVVDFIKVYWWPTFNFADAFIVMAVLLFTWEILIREDSLSQL